MFAALPVPILSVTAEAVKELQGQDALCDLWTIFTKCKESVQDGRRLENISWRLWYRELVQAQLSYRPLTPDSTKSRLTDERSLASFFPADANEKVSPQFQVLSSGLPSPSDQASPCPLPTPMPTMVPPPTPERPRISPHCPGSEVPLSSSFTRGKSTPCVGRLIVDMLPNQVCIPQRKASHSLSDVTPVPSTPPPATQSSDLKVPLVQFPATPIEPLFPRVVVVNPTPHPTPPMTPILHDDLPGAPQPPSTFLLPPLPPPALRPAVPQSSDRQQQAEQQSDLSRPLIPKELSPPQVPARVTEVGSSARYSDRRFFLKQSPEDGSLERGDGSTASGKSPSDLFEASSVASSQMKSVLTDVDVEEDQDQKDDDQEDEEDEDRRSTATGAGAGGRHARGRQKPKRGKEAGKARPAMRRSHSAKHVAPSMLRKLSSSTQQQPAQPRHQPQPSQERGRAEKKGAMFNIGSGSSNGSRSATGSSGVGAGTAPQTRGSPAVQGLTAIQATPKVTPPQAHPPVIPNEYVNGRAAAAGGNPALQRNANPNGTANGNVNTQSRKTIVVANTSSEEYETTDAEDSEAWASEEMDAEDKAREAEETRLREAALEAQRQRELFAKIPKRSYSNLNRTNSGLLSQLMNPNPAIFPPNHPYRVSRSSADISRQYQQVQQNRGAQVQRSSSAFAPPRLSTSKSTAALPMAAQITAIGSSRPPPSSGMKRQENEINRYRPKGPPKEQEMEDDSGDDAEDRIQVSQSVAQQRLQALMSRRSSEQSTSSHLIQPVAMDDDGPELLNSTVTMPIPLGYPYNLPAPTPPMTPRTTRRRMLKMELSESMRRQLLWERQVSNPALVARRTSQGPLGGLRPLTSTSNGESSKDTSSTKSAEGQDKDERRRRALARNRSWADDYHYSGW